MSGKIVTDQERLAGLMKPARILMVEDDRDMFLLISGMFRQKFSVELVDHAADCRQAREKFNNDYDIITLDYRLPDGNGIELLEEFVKDPDHPLIIMVTAHGDEEVAAESFRKGAFAYVVKDTRMKSILPETTQRAIDSIEYRETQKALEESEERFRMIADSSFIGIFVNNGNRVTYVNDRILEMTGYPREHFKGAGESFDFLVGEDRERVIENLYRIFAGEPFEQPYDIRFVRRNGEVAEAQLMTSIISEGGNPAVLVMVNDVTKQREFEKALKKSEERFRYMTEAMNDIAFTVDMNLNTTYVSDNVERILGFTPEERVKQTAREQITPDSLKFITRRLVAELQRDGEEGVEPDRRVVEELEYYKKDGSTLTLEMTASFMRDEDGNPVGIYGLARDINERKKAQEELESINRELKGYAHTVSHDLKGPISSIKAGLEAVSSLVGPMLEGMDEDKRDDLEGTIEIIRSGVEKSRSLIEDLLFLAESNRRPRNARPVSVHEKVAEIIQDRRRDIEEAGITIRAEKYLGEVIAEPSYIYQLFSNLIGNAIEYAKSEKPLLEISYFPTSEGDHHYLVRDNGPGVPEEIIEKVFQPFVTGNGGTGIGLAIARQIVETYDGQIRAYKEEGACFEFTLKDWHGE